jgi:hypothetical protein
MVQSGAPSHNLTGFGKPRPADEISRDPVVELDAVSPVTEEVPVPAPEEA